MWSGILIYILCLSLILLIFRKYFDNQKLFPFIYISMIKTNFGIYFMKSVCRRYPKMIKKISTVGIYICFISMIYITYEVIKSTAKIFLSPSITAGVSLVLPFEAKGVFYVPFAYWLISILIVILVHEAGHGIVASLYKIRVKKTGFAIVTFLLPLIPAAFVEPNENLLNKKGINTRLAVFSAGPFSNILLAIILIPLFLGANHISDTMHDYQGVMITEFSDGYDAVLKLQKNMVITELNDKTVFNQAEFSSYLGELNPGDVVQVTTQKGVFDVQLGQHPSGFGAYMGVFIKDRQVLKNPSFINKTFVWFNELLKWILILNLGVGLFNLLPIGILDGGQMLHIILSEKSSHARHITRVLSTVLLLVVLSGILANFL